MTAATNDTKTRRPRRRRLQLFMREDLIGAVEAVLGRDDGIYLNGNWETGCATIECEREECRVPGDCEAGLCFWRQDLPYNATLAQAAAAIVEHAATHKRRTA